MILFTQSTTVLHKYFNDELKIHCLLQFSLTLHRIPRVFHVQRNPWVFQVYQVCGHPDNYRWQSGFPSPIFHRVMYLQRDSNSLLLYTRWQHQFRQRYTLIATSVSAAAVSQWSHLHTGSCKVTDAVRHDTGPKLFPCSREYPASRVHGSHVEIMSGRGIKIVITEIQRMRSQWNRPGCAGWKINARPRNKVACPG